jgi:hypothetical protein
MNAADVFDIGNFSEDGTKEIKVNINIRTKQKQKLFLFN